MCSERDVEHCAHFVTVEGSREIPPCPIFLGSNLGYSTFLYTSYEEPLSHILKQQVLTSMCQDIITFKEGRWVVSGILCPNRPLLKRLKQTLPDTCSFRKRIARDPLFASLFYFSLMSRHNATNETGIATKVQQIEKVQGRLL